MSEKSRNIRKEKKNAHKYGRNPITGEVFNKRTYKQYNKYGIDQETGLLLSKFDASNKKTRRITREGRRDTRLGRNETKQTRSENGNTLFDSLNNIFGNLNI